MSFVLPFSFQVSNTFFTGGCTALQNLTSRSCCATASARATAAAVSVPAPAGPAAAPAAAEDEPGAGAVAVAGAVPAPARGRLFGNGAIVLSRTTSVHRWIMEMR